jgi:polysaccharide deacetylase 2 family uncharacterized protein YibQ
VLRILGQQGSRPALALVVDDWGDRPQVSAVGRLPQGVSLAILPGRPYSRPIAQAAWSQGHEVLVHLPLEPKAGLPLEEGTLKSGMPEEKLAVMAESEFLSVPHAVGLNNHEGSKATEDPKVMRPVLAMLKKRGAFFLDSLTTPNSVAGRLASEMGVRTVSRQVFLDNQDFIDSIEESMRQAIYLAKTTGSCVAIGHPRANTLAVLKRLAPEAARQGVDLVPVSDLVK